MARRIASVLVSAVFLVAASAHAQGRPDVVWARGGHPPYGSVGLGYTPDASRVVSLGFDGTIKVFRTSDGTLERTIPAFSQRGKALALSPDGVTIAATGSDWIDYFTGKDFGALRLWRLSDGALIRTITTTLAIQSPSALAFSPDGQTLAIDGSVGVRLWRVSDGVLLRTIVNPHSPANATPDLIGVVFSRDGRSLATQANDLMQLRVADGTLLRSYGGYTGCGHSPALSPDGALIANCSSVYRTADGVKVSALVSNADFMSFSPDGLETGGWELRGGAGPHLVDGQLGAPPRLQRPRFVRRDLPQCDCRVLSRQSEARLGEVRDPRAAGQRRGSSPKNHRIQEQRLGGRGLA